MSDNKLFKDSTNMLEDTIFKKMASLRVTVPQNTEAFKSRPPIG